MNDEELAGGTSDIDRPSMWLKLLKNRELHKLGTALLLLATVVYVASSRSSGSTHLPASYVTADGAPERRFEEVFLATLGQWHVSGRIPTIAALEYIKQTSGPDQDGILASVAYRTDADSKFMYLREAIKITQRVFSEPALNDVKAILLRPHITGIDDYGKPKEVQTGKALIRRAVAAKMDLQNITADGFESALKREGVFEFRDLRK